MRNFLDQVWRVSVRGFSWLLIRMGRPSLNVSSTIHELGPEQHRESKLSTKDTRVHASIIHSLIHSFIIHP